MKYFFNILGLFRFNSYAKEERIQGKLSSIPMKGRDWYGNKVIFFLC
jgi:hypothetical protein